MIVCQSFARPKPARPKQNHPAPAAVLRVVVHDDWALVHHVCEEAPAKQDQTHVQFLTLGEERWPSQEPDAKFQALSCRLMFRLQLLAPDNLELKLDIALLHVLLQHLAAQPRQTFTIGSV